MQYCSSMQQYSSNTEAIQKQYSSNAEAIQKQYRRNNEAMQKQCSIIYRRQILVQLQGLWPINFVVPCDLPIPVSPS